jgi:hypothetical protein
MLRMHCIVRTVSPIGKSCTLRQVKKEMSGSTIDGLRKGHRVTASVSSRRITSPTQSKFTTVVLHYDLKSRTVRVTASAAYYQREGTEMTRSKRNGLSWTSIAAGLAATVFISGLASADEPKPDRSTKVDMAVVKLAEGEPTPASQIPNLPANGEMTFVLSDLSPLVYPGWDACPTGWARTNKEQFLATVSAEEQTRLLKPENETELTGKWKASTSGPENTNVCSNYDRFPNRALQATVQNKVAYGVNLDGTQDGMPKDSYFCPHEKFESPLGERGIDNQAYRAHGCSRIYRGPGGGEAEASVAGKGQVTTGQFTAVMILRGVDSWVHDDHVEVILASSDQQPIVDNQHNFARSASYNVSNNPRWRNVLHGEIVNGVLTTDSKDILLLRTRGLKGYKPKPGAGSNWDWDFEKARLRLAFRPDGTLEGVLGAYELPVDLLHAMIGGGRGTAQIAGIDCAAMFNTLMKLADGGRDPNTGQCTRDSTAYRVTATPAFVFDHPPQSVKTAAADLPQR